LNILVSKLKEVLYTVLPITIIVLILNFTLTPIPLPLIVRFLLGAFFIVIGLTIFLAGVDIGLTPIGNIIGQSLTKSNKIWIVTLSGLFLGFIVCIAEPDLHILADQVELVSSGLISKVSIVVVVSIGVGVLIALGLARIVYNFPLHKFLAIMYGIIFVLAIFTTPEFLAISFDSSGATTGALTVPFILALAAGVSSLKKGTKASEEDSFGLVGIASIGAIMAVMVMNVISKTDTITAVLEREVTISTSILEPYIHNIPKAAKEIFVALLPILVVFLVFQFISFKLPRKALRKIIFGILFTFIGLVLFLAGVNAGFMDVGNIVGYSLAILDNKTYIVIVGFILGFVTILAEPAVHVLTHQIEEVTSGYVKRNIVMFSLAIGVGFSVGLSILRILIPGLQLWHYLLPGYIISIALTFIVPMLFVGIAFDSGGVASGPMTATFILAFAQGAAEAIEGANVMVDGFGVIAMVAMTPLIALQILGFIYKVKSKKGGIKTNE